MKLNISIRKLSNHTIPVLVFAMVFLSTSWVNSYGLDSGVTDPQGEAPQLQVSGKVTSASDGFGLPGVTIRIK